MPNVTFIRYPYDPKWVPEHRFWTLSCPERETDRAIEFSNLFLCTFIPHTSILGKGNQSCWPFNLCCSATANMGLSIFTQREFRGRRCDRFWIQGHLRNRGAFPKKICKIWPKSLLPASFPGKKVRQVVSVKRLSEGGKWGLVEQA